MDYKHLPVLINEVLEYALPALNKKNAVFVDGTLGLAGHSLALAKQITKHKEQLSNHRLRRDPSIKRDKLQTSNTKIQMIGIDKDATALKIAQSNLDKAGLAGFSKLIHDDFNNYSTIIENLSVTGVDAVLLDLGVSSMQLDDKQRGFSFSDPDIFLDMRMDQTQGLSALKIVNQYSQKELERVLKSGEERHFRGIAKAIVKRRSESEISTVGDLTDIVWSCVPHKYSRTHFATDTFRALRLEVNNELSSLAATIDDVVDSLNSGGRLLIITFHSIEDRIVKNEFRRLENPCTCPPRLPHCICGLRPSIKIITKKPVIADSPELEKNPRARSAKLRVLEKL